MKGDVIMIILVTVQVILGIWFVSFALMGNAIRKITLAISVMFIIAGAGLFVPAEFADFSIPLSLVGLSVGTVLLTTELLKYRILQSR